MGEERELSSVHRLSILIPRVAGKGYCVCDQKAGLVMGKPLWSRSPGPATPGVSPPLGGLSDLEDFVAAWYLRPQLG